MPDPLTLLLLATGLLGGIISSIAGGASIVTFPVLIAAGFSPYTAALTNMIALTPGNLLAALYDRIGADLAAGRPLVVQAHVPLCDSSIIRCGNHGLGDGDTPFDIVFNGVPVATQGTGEQAITSADGQGTFTLQLRAERSGAGQGRTYTASCVSVDASNNRGTGQTSKVFVPDHMASVEE